MSLPRPFARLVSRARTLSRASRLGLALAAVAFVAAAPALGWARQEWRSRVLPQVIADTSVVFGPRTFSSPTGTQTVNVERMSVTVVPGRRYLLRIQNGLPAVTSGSVVVNGTTVVSASDFASGASSWTREIVLTGSDTLKAIVAGAAGAQLQASILETADPTVVLFGPKTYVRPSGASPMITDNFTVPEGVGAPFTLYVMNGDAQGQYRASSAEVVLNGVEQLTQSDFNQQVSGYLKRVPLAATNRLDVQVHSTPGNRLTIWLSGADIAAPVLTITAPVPNLITREPTLAVTGTVTDRTAVVVTVNGAAAQLTNGAFTGTVTLAEGANTVVVKAVDAAGNSTDSTRAVTLDTKVPTLSVTSPLDNAVVGTEIVTVRGTVQDATPVTVAVNGTPLTVDAQGAFVGQIIATEGTNFVTVVATDKAGNATTVARRVVYDKTAPVITLSSPADKLVTGDAAVTVAGTVADATTVSLTVNDVPVATGAGGAFSTSFTLKDGDNTITIAATDAAGNVATLSRLVTKRAQDVLIPNDLPIDRSLNAPAVNTALATVLGTANTFLYSGPNAVQTGVAPGTIAPLRTSIIRGRTLSRAGTPLAGITVRIHGHPQFGQTLTRANGQFDLAVNGGGTMIVEFTRANHLPVQRPIDTRWQQYAIVDDVVLTELDSRVTRVDFTAAMQPARGGIVSDRDGSRQATLLFPQGTTATMVLADQTTRPLPAISVRATEYTVGINGRKAMPGPLPTFSAYTYAAELSVDEATAAGAVEVRFSKTIPFYIENFLRMPVGTAVPVGYYDRQKSGWVPQANGRVIKVLSVTGGLADIDANGDKAVDDAAQLASLGVTDAERVQLAALYQPGTSLWRMPLKHFTPIDANYQAGPEQGDLGGGAPKGKDEEKKEKPTEKCGSIIECENQVLGERLPVTGTPFTLNYRSRRAAGYTPARVITIPVTGPTVPDSATRIELRIWVAGRRFEKQFPVAPNQTYDFAWDGLDAYGREVSGAQWVTTHLGYAYNEYYSAPAPGDQSFGLPCPLGTGPTLCPIRREDGTMIRREASEAMRWVQSGGWVGGIRGTEIQALGGWTLDVHHTYDPTSATIHMGDGSVRSGKQFSPSISTLIGDGVSTATPDGPVAGTRTQAPFGVAVAPDGTVYWADARGNRVRKLTPAGQVVTVAGTGTPGFSGDGGPGPQAQPNSPLGIALGVDGSVYVADQVNNRIRRVSPSGIITTVAGIGPVDGTASGFSGDGGPAMQAQLNYPTSVAVAPDGNVFVADYSNERVRRINQDGTIQTVAGTGPTGTGACQPTGDGGSSMAARLCRVNAIKIGPDGGLYLSDDYGRIRRVGQDGIIRKFAGTEFGFAGDGGPATAARLSSVMSMDFGPDGALYLADWLNHRIRRIGVDGVITTVAGTVRGYAGDLGPSTAALLSRPGGVTVAPDGAIYIADSFNDRIRVVRPALPGLSLAETAVTDESGTDRYIFDGAGRHLRTVDAMIGVDGTCQGV